MSNKDGEERFWGFSPLDLFKSLTIVPDKNMSLDAKLNALTRLVILITAGMAVAGFDLWWIFLIAGIGIVFLVKILNQNGVGGGSREEGYSLLAPNPVYQSGSDLTSSNCGSAPIVVAPILSQSVGFEEWTGPEVYDEYSLEPQGCCEDEVVIEGRPIHGSYYVGNAKLPYGAQNLSAVPLSEAKLIANDAFTYDVLTYRNSMTEGYLNSSSLLYRNQCSDKVSSYTGC